MKAFQTLKDFGSAGTSTSAVRMPIHFQFPLIVMELYEFCSLEGAVFTDCTGLCTVESVH